MVHHISLNFVLFVLVENDGGQQKLAQGYG
jgi:hypothetical protein